MKYLIPLFVLAVCAHAQYWPIFFPWVPYPSPWQPPRHPPYVSRPPYWHFPQPTSYYPPPQPPPPPPPPQDDEYAASLGGAPVGLYNRRQNTGPFGMTSEVTGVSLGNAEVGLYGKDRTSLNPGYNPY